MVFFLENTPLPKRTTRSNHLQRSATHHRRWPKQVTDSDEEIIPDPEVEERAENALDEGSQSDNSEPARKRAKRNSTHHHAKPTQPTFYPGTWADILGQAKQYFRLWLVKECPFPEHGPNLRNAQDALKKAIREFEKNDCEVEDGTC